MKYLPHTQADLQAMLRVVGAASLDELYAEVPDELKFKGELAIPSAQSEIAVRRNLTAMAELNDPLIPFAGAGAYDHYTPSLVPYLAQRSEFSTSYTPYQAEISQGTLQYIFEYQTMMAALTGMDLSNASMYDGATATAEAGDDVRAAAKKRTRVLLSDSFLPAVRRVVETYAHYHGVDLVVVPARDGVSDLEAMRHLLEGDDVAGVIVPQPNRYGLIEDFTGLADACHTHKALLVINTVASALGVLRSPGDWGADIACGDAQSLGLPLAYGGPYIGYLCTRTALVRKMPGRLVGATVDAEGKRCFVLTMQAREQHIRREKATSNICTAQGFMCLHVAAYLSVMGAKGLREVNALSYANAHYLHDALLATGCFEEVYPRAPYLLEFTLRYVGELPLAELRQALGYEGYLCGVVDDDDDTLITFCATEQRSRAEIEAFAQSLAELAQPDA